MRILHQTMLLAFVLILGYLTLSTTDVMERKTNLPLSEKVQNLMELNKKQALMQFNYHQFVEYVMNSPRNYSMIVMLTALSSVRSCKPCRIAHEDFNIVAQAYRSSPAYSNNLFFAMVDYDDAPDIFHLLELGNVPTFVYFPPTGEMKIMNFYEVRVSIESIKKFVYQSTGIRISNPIGYAKIVTMVTFAVLAGEFLYMMPNVLYNKSVWGVIAVLYCWSMISGQMWNHIRKPPLLQSFHNGAVEYIHKYSRRQLLVESYIVMVLYVLTFFSMLLLIESGRQSNSFKSRIMSTTGLIFYVIFFSLLLSVFHVKRPDYPYTFLFH